MASDKHSYKHRYHPFFPIAHVTSLDQANIRSTASNEPHLLTALLTIASKDDPSLVTLHEKLVSYMQELISTVIWTGSGDLQAVEGKSRIWSTLWMMFYSQRR